MYIDTHAHLNFPEFKHEVPDVLGRAKKAKVKRIINCGVDLETSKKSWELARKYPEVFASVGIHPHSACDIDMETRTVLMDLAYRPKVIAIGEVGLDYYFLKRSSKFAKYPSREAQIFAFEQMLDTALELRFPVIVHSREAEADTIAVLKGYSSSIRGVVHCFSGNYEFAKKILDLGFLLSFTGNITYKSSLDIIDVIKRVPLGSMMIETDCPYLAPELYRAKRNEPAYVVEVAKKIAEIKDVSLEEVARTTSKKATSFFKLDYIDPRIRRPKL